MYGWGAAQPSNCDFFGVFKPECVCNPELGFLSWLCTDENQKGALRAAHPETIVPPPMPPIPGPPSGSLTTVAPADGAQAQAVIDGILAKQMKDWQAGNLQAGQQSQQNLETIFDSSSDSSSGIPWYVWLAGGLGLFGVVALSAGGPRRYGR